MTLHDLILITAAFVVGFIVHYLLEVWADHRAKPFRDGWQKATDDATRCRLNEAYRLGLEQAINQMTEAPIPWRGQ